MDDFPDEHNPLNLISITINGSEGKAQDNLIQEFAESTSAIPNDIDSTADSNLLESEVSEDPNLLQIETHGESSLLDAEKSSNETNLLQSVTSNESTLLSTAVDTDRAISAVDNEEVDLFTIQGVENEEFTNHACVNFQEKVYQYLGDGGQVFQTNGYECLQCSQMYSESELQELAENRQQKPHRQTIDCLPSALDDPSPAAIDLDLTSITQDQQQNIGSTVEMTTSDSTLINTISSQESQPHVIIDAGIDGITSVESNETKFLIGQPRVATEVVEYPQIFTDSNTDLKINDLEKQLGTPTIENVNINQNSEPSDLLVQGDNEIALQMNDITHLIENSEYADQKTDSYTIQTNEISDIQSDEVVGNQDQSEEVHHQNDLVKSDFIINEDNISSDSRSHANSETIDTTHDNIVVTFSKKKPPSTEATELKGKQLADKESETMSRNESQTVEESVAPITDSQQKALDRLITELEKTSQNPDTQQTKVFVIDEMSDEQETEESSKNDNEAAPIELYRNTSTAAAESSDKETDRNVDMPSSSKETSDEGLDEDEDLPCINDEDTQDSDEGGIDNLTVDTEAEVDGDPVDNDGECSNIIPETKERMNEMFDAVDSAKSYMNLYEQVEKKGILPALRQSVKAEPEDQSSEQGPSIVSVRSLSEVSAENTEASTNQNLVETLKQPIGRTLYMTTKATGSKTMTLYQCSYCKVAFFSKAILEVHCKQVHLDKINEDTNSPPNKKLKTREIAQEVNEVNEGNVYICKCKARFNSTKELEVHLETVDHSELINQFKCVHENCDRTFWTHQALNAHMMTHSNQYIDKMNNKRPTILIPVEPYIPSAGSKQMEDLEESKQAITVARKLFSAGCGNETEVSGAKGLETPLNQVESIEEYRSGQVSEYCEEDMTEETHTQVKSVVRQEASGSQENMSLKATTLDSGARHWGIKEEIKASVFRQKVFGAQENMRLKPTTSIAGGHPSDIMDEIKTRNSNIDANTDNGEPSVKEVSDAVILEDNSLFMNQPVIKLNGPSSKSQMEKDILSITCIRCNKSYSCAEKWNYRGTLQCSACRWNFESPPHLQCHFDHFHTFDRECPLCNFQSVRCSSSVMDKHFKTVHPNKEIFHCYLCEATFTTRACLRNHVSRHFSQTGSYECPHCHMKFEKESRLNIHKVRNHSMLLSIPKGVKTPEQSTLYMCGICGRQYEYEGTLRIHLRKHQTTSNVVEHMDISNAT